MQELVKEGNGLEEVCASFEHGEVDGVEVLLAAEAACEVGLGIGGGMELVATRAEEAEAAVGDLPGELEDVGNEEANGDLISQLSEMGLGEWSRHGSLSFLRELEFSHGFVDEGFGELLYVSSGGVE